MPDAPSAAKEERFLRPIAICAPQISRPATPATMTPHLPQPRMVVIGPPRPGSATGAGFSTGPA